MKRYSIASSAARRRDTVNEGSNNEPSVLELERFEQEITLVLQEIDKNLLKSNAVINDKILPILKQYGTASTKVWNNVNFWKYFMEQAANVELNGYEEPANPQTTESNTLKNTRTSNLLIQEGNDKFTEDKETIEQSRKPIIGRTFHNIEETPTWSVQQQTQLQHQEQRKDFTVPTGVSTPQRTNKLKTTKFDVTESWKLDSIPSMIPQANPAVITHTIRQSLDNYHKLSISPKKYTPNRRTREDRRSSIVQRIIDSSPTLPEPPVLLSEIKDNKQPNDPETSPLKSMKPNNKSDIQRFPVTPRVSGGGESFPISVERIRERYTYDDSDIPPPNVTSTHLNTEYVPLPVESAQDEDDSPPPVPELTSEIILNEKRSVEEDESGESRTFKRQNVNEDDNVFVEKQNSATSTLYHSLSKIASENSTVSGNISATYAKFQQVLQDSNQEGGINNNNINNNNVDDDDDTGNASELGSFLRERYRKIMK